MASILALVVVGAMGACGERCGDGAGSVSVGRCRLTDFFARTTLKLCDEFFNNLGMIL